MTEVEKIYFYTEEATGSQTEKKINLAAQVLQNHLHHLDYD